MDLSEVAFQKKDEPKLNVAFYVDLMKIIHLAVLFKNQ